MRPVYREPQTALDSVLPRAHYTVYSYHVLGGALLRQIGEYCSYCEVALAGNAAVEHIMSKSQDATLETEWDNFLLACVNCNSRKGAKTEKASDLDDYLWPCDITRDSSSAYQYYWDASAGVGNEVARVRVSPTAPTTYGDRPANTLALVGLDIDRSQDPAVPDRRADNRTTTWRVAVRLANDLASFGNTLAAYDGELAGLLIDQIVATATSLGFWSVWMTVFRARLTQAGMLTTSIDALLLRLFVRTFPGTYWGANQAAFAPIPTGHTGLPGGRT
ncbi:HNH endonuclease signature motif containing protein [Frankia sp. R82]|uniref:HNH endonuclease signature motif containing protein n=1 Tax=Frankia sp. R82 TaxID=2950553 RepID=UPI002043997E|nr:HNH endonuclease signature motif containing protein [Frankia sp. R82]MCM3883852.1 HNH endonuclease [Frankia sp. R82]